VAAVAVVEIYRGKADVIANEILESAGGDFAQALEAADLVGTSSYHLFEITGRLRCCF
jgi:hypothetical protein